MFGTTAEWVAKYWRGEALLLEAENTRLKERLADMEPAVGPDGTPFRCWGAQAWIFTSEKTFGPGGGTASQSRALNECEEATTSNAAHQSAEMVEVPKHE